MTCGLRATPPSLLPFGWVGCALPTPPRRNPRIAGFSLLEMLLVITLLGMLSLAAVVLTESSDDQARYDDTKNRLLAIKRAIIGDTSRTINGEPEISGFVADMGRLPACVQELLEILGDCEDSGQTSLAFDLTGVAWGVQASGVGAGLGAGWRGPYLDYLPSRSGVAAFLDGWGNKWSGVAQSLGKDRAVTNPPDNSYNDDYPSSALISAKDWEVTLTGWSTVAVELNNLSSVAHTINANDLALRINYPVDGAFTNANGVSATTFPDVNISLPGTGAPGSISVTTPTSATVPQGSSISGVALYVPNAGDVEIGTTARKKVRLSNCPCEITSAPTNFSLTSLSGTTLQITAGTLTIPAGSRVQLTAEITGLPDIPMGRRSLDVVCATPGQPYRGTCPASNTAAHPSTYFFKLVPRAATPTPPNPLIWEIN